MLSVVQDLRTAWRENERLDEETVLQYGLILFIGTCVIVPLAILILQAIATDSILTSNTWSFTLGNFIEVLSRSAFQRAFVNTLIFSLGSVVVAHVIGFCFAYILTRMNIPFQSAFHTLMFVPIFLSPLVLALGYGLVFTQGGYYYSLLSQFGISINITSIYGMTFISSIWLTPFTYSFMAAGLQNIDPEMEDAAKLVGAKNWKVIGNISLPLLKPFILSSLLLTILLTFQEITIPAILGIPERIYVLSTYLLTLGSNIPPPYSIMAAVGIIMVIISLVIVSGIGRLVGDVSKYTVITGRGRERSIYTPRSHQAVGVTVLSLYLLLFVIIPLFQVIAVGLTSSAVVGALSLETLSFEWFLEILSDSTLKTAIKNTVIIAVVTASVSVVMTGIISYIVDRIDTRTSRLLSIIAWIPISVPGIVLGLAFFWTVLLLPIGLYGTIFVLMLAFFIRFLALGVRMSSSLISQQAAELDEQGKVCGASFFSRLTNIIFPNIRNGMISVWIILFCLYMAELSTAIFLYTSASRVISVTLFELWFTAQYGALGALATIQVLIVFVLIAILLSLFDVDIRAV